MQGIIGKKLGMGRLFRDDGMVESVTAIEAGPCVVTQVKTKAKDGYNAAQLGFVESKPGQFKYRREFRVDTQEIKAGDKIDVSLFKEGDRVNISGLSKGRGFAGVVKRHGFAGGPKTHGQSDRHRAPGSIGSTTSPGRVLKGMRMAGHMGDSRVTARNLEICKADLEHNLLLVRGAVPGAKNGLLLIKKAGGRK